MRQTTRKQVYENSLKIAEHISEHYDHNKMRPAAMFDVGNKVSVAIPQNHRAATFAWRGNWHKRVCCSNVHCYDSTRGPNSKLYGARWRPRTLLLLLLFIYYASRQHIWNTDTKKTEIQYNGSIDINTDCSVSLRETACLKNANNAFCVCKEKMQLHFCQMRCAFNQIYRLIKCALFQHWFICTDMCCRCCQTWYLVTWSNIIIDTLIIWCSWRGG